MSRVSVALALAFVLLLVAPALASARKVHTYWVLSTNGSLNASNDRQSAVDEEGAQPDISHVDASFSWKSVKPPSYSGYPTLSVPFSGPVRPVNRFAAGRRMKATLTYSAHGRRWVVDNTFGGPGDHYVDWTCKPRTLTFRQDADLFPVAAGRSAYDLALVALAGFQFPAAGCTSATGEAGSLPSDIDFTGVLDALRFQKRMSRGALVARRSTLKMKLGGGPTDCHSADSPVCTVTAGGAATVHLAKQCKIAAIQQGSTSSCNNTYAEPRLR